MSDQTISILLVDDEARNLDALDAILSDQGYQLLRADGADLALRLLLETPVAAIVMDIKMPGVSGLELAQIIKGSKRFRQIPIVFLTAHMLDDRDVIAGYGVGAVDYLTKPVSPQILRHKIAVFADLFRKTVALAELNETLEGRVRDRTAALERSEAALRAAARQKDEFLATLAHELRNPLEPMRVGLHHLMTLEAAPVDASVTPTLVMMNRQLDHMVRLIDDLLDVSRISGGMLELKKKQLDVPAALRAAAESNRAFFERRNQTLVVDAATPIAAMADPTRIAQVIGNLLHNASKFSPEGSEIRMSLTREHDNAVIRVIDAGVGIAPDQIGRVFEMFTRIDRSLPGASEGLGIGLSLSRRLAELHGGALTAESAGAGRGSTFTFSIPAEAEMSQMPERSGRIPRVAQLPPLNVVVVEDNEDAADTLGMWLERVGLKVEIARTGPDGLALVERSRPDIVLCDIGLPGMDGIELCKQVRQLQGFQPVMVALTGWGMEEDRRRTREAGFDHHLVKPVDPQRLLDLLRTTTARVA